MTLKETILAATALTGELYETLAESPPDSCQDLLEKRGQAMSAFQAVHQTATETDREACQAQLQDLREIDQLLQQRADASFTVAKDQLRANVGTTPNYAGAYNETPTIACVDRKA